MSYQVVKCLYLLLCLIVCAASQSDEPSIMELFPNASVSHIAGAGHWVHSEKLTEVVASIKKFYQNNR